VVNQVLVANIIIDLLLGSDLGKEIRPSGAIFFLISIISFYLLLGDLQERRAYVSGIR
jgi:hypothetical protein